MLVLFRFISYGLAIGLELAGHLLRGELNRAFHKLGHVIALKKLSVQVGVFGWQLEWLAAVSLGIDMGDERACKDTVVSA